MSSEYSIHIRVEENGADHLTLGIDFPILRMSFPRTMMDEKGFQTMRQQMIGAAETFLQVEIPRWIEECDVRSKVDEGISKLYLDKLRS